ncbi:23S rRNA (uracil-C(5))-methyltransferase RlmCD [bioreactor metagenome]|uniref:23S rRNA (Uracil-C(5))-methyltransferase RlmCD n=1 Tax=bioreactor metagenome TaxID=1076179 RepID=A0A645ERU1_9ZZZZ
MILGKNFTLISGKPYIEDILCGVKVRISPDGFYQVNREGAELLYNTGIKAASLKKGDLVLDLYCGAGMISLAASKIVPEIKIIGVEIVESAVENARLNARANGVYDAEYYQGDASDLDSILACRKEKPACVIVDPPRKGCAASTLDYIVKTGTEKILYISCDPDTLARDMAILTGKGYAPSTSVIPVDMFPRTGHVETVVLMTRNI